MALLSILSAIIVCFALYNDYEVLHLIFLIIFIISLLVALNVPGVVYSFFSSYDWSTFFVPLV